MEVQITVMSKSMKIADEKEGIYESDKVTSANSSLVDLDEGKEIYFIGIQ